MNIAMSIETDTAIIIDTGTMGAATTGETKKAIGRITDTYTDNGTIEMIECPASKTKR